MKKLLLILFSLPLIGFSQSFNWGYPYPITDETDATITHFYDGEKLYKQYEKYDLSIFNFHVVIDQLSANELELQSTKDLTKTPIKIDQYKLTHLKSYQDNKDTNFTFFSYIFNLKTKVNQLYWNSANIATGQKGEAKPITKIQGKNLFKAGNWHLNQSENKAHYVVLKEYPYAKKTNEKLGILVLDKDKNIVKEKIHTFSMPDRRNKVNKPFISNNGNVFIIKDIKLKKQKPYLNIYYWNPTTDQVKEISLKLNDNYQIYQYGINFDAEDNMYFNGLITHKGSKFFSMSIDLYGNASGVPASGIIAVKIDKNGELVYNKRNGFGKQIISNVNLKKTALNNNNLWLLADKRYVIKKTDNTSLGQGNTKYDYTYQNTGIFLALVNTKDGTLTWKKDLDYNEPKTRNDNGALLSYINFFKGDDLVILYNATRNLETTINRRIRKYRKKVPVMLTINPSGDRNSSQSKDLTNAGIGTKIDATFDLDTSMLLKVKEDTYIIRAKSNAEYKYGYIKL